MNELKLIEKELVPVYETNTGEKVVNGRELWTVLKSKRQFVDWIKERFNDVEAIKNIDFTTFSQKNEKGRPAIEYIIKLDIAKEIAMLERNEIGKQVRKYFIEIEKKYKKVITDGTESNIQSIEIINQAANIIIPVVEVVGIEPIHKTYLLKQLYDKAGIEIPMLRVEQDTQLYDKTMIADKLGIYSISNKPHAQAVGAIIKKLDIDNNNIILTSFNRNGHTGTDYQYKPIVMQQISQWLEENKYPKIIDDNNKSYKVIYKKIDSLF